MNGESHLPVNTEEFGEFQRRSNALLTSVSWKPMKRMNCGAPEKSSGVPAWSSTPVTDQVEQSTSVMKAFREIISQDPLLLSEDANHILHALRDGMCLGLVLAKNYGKAAGLDVLSQQNARAGGLSGPHQAEFAEKNATMAAIGLFGMASYVVWKLSGYKSDEVSAIKMEFPGIPEVYLTNIHRAFDCAVFYYGFCIEKAGFAKTGLQALKLTDLYFEKMLDEIRNRISSLKHTDFFTRVSYQLHGTDFVIKGFEPVGSTISVSTEFREVRFSEIVGNREAKHAARRFAERLVCYDLVAQKNPFYVLGGISDVSMGFGKPGTGKSMQIAATATILKEYCELLGIPFVFWPIPDNVISSFQGGSAERVIPWMQRLADPDKIVYATIDDGENNFEDRSRQGVSEGVRSVIGVFLRYTEGAYAIRRGNSAIQIFTNLPEQIDKAVLSRVQSRFSIDGATTPHDFCDQNYLWQQKIEKIVPGFTNIEPMKGYKFLADQEELRSMAELSKLMKPEFNDPRMRDIAIRIQKETGSGGHGFFAQLFKGAQSLYPTFTSRDVRNIQKAVDIRMMDFDLPSNWFEDLSLFFQQSYEIKFSMVTELMRANMKGLTFEEIFYEEAIKYLNVVATITDTEREREITQHLRHLDVREEAERRYRQPK